MERIADLEAQLNQNSSNSNRPPSKDTPKQRRGREKSAPGGRKRGGQPGHKTAPARDAAAGEGVPHRGSRLMGHESVPDFAGHIWSASRSLVRCTEPPS